MRSSTEATRLSGSSMSACGPELTSRDVCYWSLLRAKRKCPGHCPKTESDPWRTSIGSVLALTWIVLC